MYHKSVSLCLLLVAILFGCALTTVEAASSTVSLHVSGSSSVWWIAVAPQNDNGATAKVELKDSAATSYVTLELNQGWGYYSASSSSGRPFSAPLTFRLTSSSGATITVQVNSLVPDAVIDTGSSYGGSVSTPTAAPTTKPPTAAPTTKPPTAAPTTKPPTAAPTTKPPTAAPTTRPATAAPTTKPPTAAPTTRPATAAPTTRPTTAPTTAPTSKPTTAPTTKPTTAPTTKPTTKPTTAPSSDLCAVTDTSSEPLQILVPLYVYPGAAWDTVISAASKAKIIAIINPSSGPLSTVDSTYSNYMTKLKNAGVDLVGYVHTTYGTRAIATVKSEIDLYASKYPLVNGIFLDEASDSAAQLPYYTELYNYIIAKGYIHDIVNPGVQPDQGYLAASTNIVIFENYASSLSSTSFSSWVKCAPSASQKAGYKYKFSGIVHTATSGSQAANINTLANMGVGLVYVTDGVGGCCTYNTLASFFATEATSVQALN